jgi:hypothetical protein
MLLSGAGYWSIETAGVIGFFFVENSQGSGIFGNFSCFGVICGAPPQDGTTWSDVAASPVTAPEGSSLAMMGMTGMGLLGVLKRKFFMR